MEKPKILIVDDMEEVHNILIPLEKRYYIDHALSEEKALNMIKKNNYRGILTDYHLGDGAPKGGLKIIRAAKREGLHVLLMSKENHRKEALEAGASGFVFKKRLFNKYNPR